MPRLSAEQVVIGCGHSFDPMTAVVDTDGREVCPICFEIGTIRQERDEAVKDRNRAKFMPIGDNHHNALLCPYCNPNNETMTELADCAKRDKRIAELEAERDQARQDVAELVKALMALLECHCDSCANSARAALARVGKEVG